MKDSRDVPQIVALLPNWLGDVAMCTPALRALRTRFPEASFCVAGRPTACQLLEGLPWFDHQVRIPPRPGSIMTLRAAWRLRRYARDISVIFPHSTRTALLAWLAGSRRRIGYDREGRSFLLTDPVAPYRENGRITPVYMAREYLDLVGTLGCEDDGQGLELHTAEEELAAVRRYLPGEGRVVGIAPGAAFGPSKCWPAERYAAVADKLASEWGAHCVLLTGPGEEDTRAAVLGAARTCLIECHEGHPTIARLKASIAALDLLICNDSGPRHIAIAFKKPVICIMGPTSPRYTESPWEIGRVLRVDVDCGPCQQPTCATDHRCMTSITTDDVVEAARAYLPR